MTEMREFLGDDGTLETVVAEIVPVNILDTVQALEPTLAAAVAFEAGEIMFQVFGSGNAPDDPRFETYLPIAVERALDNLLAKLYEVLDRRGTFTDLVTANEKINLDGTLK